MWSSHRPGRHPCLLGFVELSTVSQRIRGPESLHHLYEFLHLPVAAAVGFDPATVHVVLGWSGAVDDVDAESATRDPVDAGSELRHHTRVRDAWVDRSHQLHPANDRRQRRRENPGIEVRPEPTLRDQRDAEAEIFRSIQQVRSIFEIAIGTTAVAGQRIEMGSGFRVWADRLGSWTPDAELHTFPHPLLISGRRQVGRPLRVVLD
jgi:hypothetical protein